MDMMSELGRALELIGDRWSLQVVEALLSGPRRFNDLRAELAEIAPNILSSRLKHLEASGIVTSRLYSDKPVRLSYDLTPLGRSLEGAITMLTAWASSEVDGLGATHDRCGSGLQARYWCPTCRQVVERDEHMPFV